MTEQAEIVDPLDGAISSDEPSETLVTCRTRKASGLLDRPYAVDVAALAGLVGAVAFLWGRAASMSFWLDEGISAGVVAHSLRSIPHVLLQDGSPPLYYMLLSIWTSLLGTSNVAVHLLSLLFAVATIPVALWAGWSLFDRRTGWMCALVMAVNPFAAYYATEARMYSMAILLALVATATFLHSFVFGRRRYLPWFVLSQALLMYTHNWGLLLGLGLGAAVVPILAMTDDRRRLIIDAVVGFGAVAVLYVPWVPSLAYQIGQHLQPWGRKADLVWLRDDIAQLLGGNEAFVALGLGAGIGLAALLQARGWSRQATAVLTLAVVTAVTLGAGWRESVWAYRYLAVVVGPLALIAAAGLARSGRTGVAALAVCAFLTAPLAVRGPEFRRSNVQAVSAEMSPRLDAGDLVLLPDFQMVPLVAHYFRPGLRYATSSGLVPDKNIVDWRHSMDRLLNDDPRVTLPPLVDTLPPGAHVLVICPPPEAESNNTGLAHTNDAQPRSSANAAAPIAGVQPEVTTLTQDIAFHRLILLRCQQTQDLVSNDVGLRLTELVKAPSGVKYTPADAMLLTRQ
ncbi:MAG: glycosyltransferase family 39 protein [Acidimicrobiales bacterium]